MKLFLLLKGSQDLFDDGCASPRFESSIISEDKTTKAGYKPCFRCL